MFCGGTIAPGSRPAIVAMMTLTLNLLARCKKSPRPSGTIAPVHWPDLKSAALPPMTLVALCVANRILLYRRAASDPGTDRDRRP